MTTEPKIRYRGKGEFITNVPARHLTKAEYDALSTDDKRYVRESSLYDYAGYREQSAKPAAAPPKPVAKQTTTAKAAAHPTAKHPTPVMPPQGEAPPATPPIPPA